MGTSTYGFGAGKREGHDASAFYSRFPAPSFSSESSVVRPTQIDTIWLDDARNMDSPDASGRERVANNSVALVVTSPPYFVGKEYEEAVTKEHVPGDYFAYLEMLEAVFDVCVAKLESGGRIAVNVANLGRKPYRSLSADVIGILQDGLGLLLRGEIIWVKGKGASGSCAWGSFRSAANPVLRDLTERVIVASKGRMDRAISKTKRIKDKLPHDSNISSEAFMRATTDVWEIQTASARRIGHPAPFPIELPKRLIELYTYSGDLVMDPFIGSGSTALAAIQTGRHYVGFDTDAKYVECANQRINNERMKASQKLIN